MNKYISFIIALECKLKKFNLPTIFYFDSAGDVCSGVIPLNWNMSLQEIYSRPTKAVVTDWLREKYNIFVAVLPFQDIENLKLYWYYSVVMYTENNNDDIISSTDHLRASTDNNYETFDEALDAGLKYGLNQINLKQ